MKNRKGFTLIEALAVIVLVGLLVVLISSKVLSSINESKLKANEANANSLINVIEKHYLERKMSGAFNGCYYDFDYDIGTCEDLSFSGKKPDNGFISINPDGNLVCDFGYGDIQYYCDNGSAKLIPTFDSVTAFSYSGDYDVFTAPVSGTYKLEVWGAQGGYRSNSAKAGKGGYSTGVIYLDRGDKLYVYVGGSGNRGTCTNSICTGGYNGGGYRHTYKGGGGATDMRFIANDNPTDSASLLSRVIVAGGGGSDGSTGNAGGDGGGITAGNTSGGYGDGGYGGTQTGFTSSATIASSQFTTNGSDKYFAGFGFGGFGVYRSSGYGGAGGGGWYGGVGAYPDSSADDDKGGGGGSGFVFVTGASLPNGYAVSDKYILSDVYIVGGNSTMPSHDGVSTMAGNSGDGYAKITFLERGKEKITLTAGDRYKFSFSNSERVLNIPQDGFYRLEVWGASGGNTKLPANSPFQGGKGGYSRGTVYLHKDTKVYINVGQKGYDCVPSSDTVAYNGGSGGILCTLPKDGTGRIHAGAGGGGATHIALSSGLLSSFDTDEDGYGSAEEISDILIVAGAGGGAYYHDSGSFKGHGGNGGGASGTSGTSYNNITPPLPGTQSSGGAGSRNGSFGLGGPNNTSPGGGAGFYGGGSPNGGTGQYGISGAAGGSGYIGYSAMTDGIMYCYNCAEDLNSSSLTYSTTGSNGDYDRCPDGYSSDAISDCAKLGDGAAIITFMGN